MAKNSKNTVLTLPLKITLTNDGINFFLNHNKKLTKHRLSDNVLEYGLSLDEYSASSFQRMIITGYISRIQVSGIVFTSRKKEIMDISKLVVFGLLYKKFNSCINKQLISSPLIKQWNRINPLKAVDENTSFNDVLINKFLLKNKTQISTAFNEILTPVKKRIQKNSKYSKDEKHIMCLLGSKFLNNLNGFIWYILSMSRDSKEYSILISKISSVLHEYIEKSIIAEYLSLMVIELVTAAENRHLQKLAHEIFKNDAEAQRVIYNESLRNQILKLMESQKKYLTLIWKMQGSNVSIGTENKLQIILYNRETEYKQLKQDIEEKKEVDISEKTLSDLYNELPEQKIDTELGLYYLSYLNEACKTQKIHFDTNVSQFPDKDLEIITLSLNL